MSTDTEHTRDSSTEQVEVTPELLADLEEKAGAASPGQWACWNGWGDTGREMRARRVGPQHHGGIGGSYGADVVGTRADLEHVATACPSVVLALVKRIRELEDEVADMRCRLVPRLHDSAGPPIDF